MERIAAKRPSTGKGYASVVEKYFLPELAKRPQPKIIINLDLILRAWPGGRRTGSARCQSSYYTAQQRGGRVAPRADAAVSCAARSPRRSDSRRPARSCVLRQSDFAPTRLGSKAVNPAIHVSTGLRELGGFLAVFLQLRAARLGLLQRRAHGINQNQALFAPLGTNYGGNGTTDFALPTCAAGALRAGLRRRQGVDAL